VKEDDGILVIGMALELFLLEDPRNSDEQPAYYSLNTKKPKKNQIKDEPVDYTKHDVNYYIGECHGGRKFHPGVWRTWISLNKRFPGHHITIHQVDDYVKSCVICQKNTNNMTDYVEPVRKHLKVNHPRKRIGLDTLTITPPDDDGNVCMDVIVDLFSHHLQLYPRKSHDAEALAQNLYSYYMTWGIYDQIITDPGSDIMSAAVTTLNKWLSVEHLVSLVVRHESNGVEGTNKQILRHLRTLVHDERNDQIKRKWGSPSVYKAV
jgi:hypothetical protein